MSRIGTPLALAAALLAAATAPVRAADPAPRAAAVTGISILPGASAAEVVIAVDGRPEVSDFALTAPHRLVIDVAGATMSAPLRLYDKVVRGGITNVRIAQYKADVVRIVLDLDGPRPYTLRRDDRAVRLTITGDAAFEAWHLSGAPAAVADRPAAAAPAPPPGRAAAPAPRPGADAPARFLPTAEAQSQEPRITVSFDNEPIQNVVAAFADFARRSIVVNQQLQVRITATVVDRPWDVALASLLNANGLAAITEPSGIIIVDSYQNLQTRAQSEPLSQQVVALNYARAQDLQPTIAALLSRDCGTVAGVVGGGQNPVQPQGGAGGGQGAQGGAGACPTRGSVTVEAASNSLVIFEVGSRIAELVEYTRSFDFRPQQVNIRAKVIAVDRTAAEQLGVQWDIGSANGFFNAVVQRFDATGQPLQNIAKFVNLRGDAFAAVANAGQAFENPSALSLLYNVVLGNFNLTSFIEALAQEQLSDVQAEPSVNTVDRREAEIFVGNRISYLLTPPIPPGQLQAVAPQIAQLEVGIRLRVTPYISANRTVRLTVVTEQSQLLGVTQAGPNTAQRNVTNEVLVGDGETAVIGGLTQTQVSRVRRGIPFLGSLPFIGRAFSSNENIERKQDLLVLITPHILDDQAPARP